jgi:hypothetical protein
MAQRRQPGEPDLPPIKFLRSPLQGMGMSEEDNTAALRALNELRKKLKEQPGAVGEAYSWAALPASYALGGPKEEEGATTGFGEIGESYARFAAEAKGQPEAPYENLPWGPQQGAVKQVGLIGKTIADIGRKIGEDPGGFAWSFVPESKEDVAGTMGWVTGPRGIITGARGIYHGVMAGVRNSPLVRKIIEAARTVERVAPPPAVGEDMTQLARSTLPGAGLPKTTRTFDEQGNLIKEEAIPIDEPGAPDDLFKGEPIDVPAKRAEYDEKMARQRETSAAWRKEQRRRADEARHKQETDPEYQKEQIKGEEQRKLERQEVEDVRKEVKAELGLEERGEELGKTRPGGEFTADPKPAPIIRPAIQADLPLEQGIGGPLFDAPISPAPKEPYVPPKTTKARLREVSTGQEEAIPLQERRAEQVEAAYRPEGTFEERARTGKEVHVSGDPVQPTLTPEEFNMIPRAITKLWGAKGSLSRIPGMANRNRALVEMVYSTGGRKQSIVGKAKSLEGKPVENLTLSDIIWDDLTDRQRKALKPYFKDLKAKGISPESHPDLPLFHKGDETALGPDGLRRVLASLGEEIGVSIPPHSLRRRAAQDTLEGGATMQDVSEGVLHHAPGRAQRETTETYVRGARPEKIVPDVVKDPDVKLRTPGERQAIRTDIEKQVVTVSREGVPSKTVHRRAAQGKGPPTPEMRTEEMYLPKGEGKTGVLVASEITTKGVKLSPEVKKAAEAGEMAKSEKGRLLLSAIDEEEAAAKALLDAGVNLGGRTPTGLKRPKGRAQRSEQIEHGAKQRVEEASGVGVGGIRQKGRIKDQPFGGAAPSPKARDMSPEAVARRERLDTARATRQDAWDAYWDEVLANGGVTKTAYDPGAALVPFNELPAADRTRQAQLILEKTPQEIQILKKFPVFKKMYETLVTKKQSLSSHQWTKYWDEITDYIQMMKDERPKVMRGNRGKSKTEIDRLTAEYVDANYTKEKARIAAGRTRLATKRQQKRRASDASIISSEKQKLNQGGRTRGTTRRRSPKP